MLTVIADISLRIAAAAAAVGLVLVVLRVRSGAARHAAWSAVLLAMLTMPVLMAIVPRVEVTVPSSLALDFEPASGESYAAGTYVPPMRDGLREPQLSRAATLPRADSREGPVPRSIGWRTAALAIYLAGVFFFLVRIAAGWILALRLVAGATRVESGNRAPVFESDAVAIPMTTGILSPCVLLPTAWREWPADKRNAVLAHENAHIMRRDALVALIAHVNRAIFWFHPLAWWLQRTLAVTAEHACDEAAAREVGHPRRYAEVLLDMAEAVRARGHRVSWQTIGVDGSGLLGTRIDRLLRGDAMARMSGAQRAAVALACGSALVLAIACQQRIAAEPLRPDPDVQKQLDQNKAQGEKHRAAIPMTAADAAALERSLEANPDDAVGRDKLIIFYDQAGKVSWEEKLAGMRKHTLWRIAHLPETDLWIPTISKRYDPQGYAQAKQLWLAQTTRPEVTAKTLGRAAAFMSAYDKPEAEKLLLRAQQMEPDGPWLTRLGELYAGAIVGLLDPRYGTRDPEEAKSPFAAEARGKLDAASDPKLLAAAGSALARRVRTGDAVSLGRRYLERALALDPQNVRAQAALADLAYGDRYNAIAERLHAASGRLAFNESSEQLEAAIAALPEEDRLFYLPGAAAGAYMGAEYIEYTGRDKPEAERAQAQKRAAAGFERARKYASDVLELAKRHPQAAADNAAIYHAHTVLGVVALKDGDRKRAVEHMRMAGAAPVSAAARYSQDGLRGRLVEYLLRMGERDSVAVYLEQSAERFARERERMRKDAAQIRAGVMPLSFQYAEARR